MHVTVAVTCRRCGLACVGPRKPRAAQVTHPQPKTTTCCCPWYCHRQALQRPWRPLLPQLVPMPIKPKCSAEETYLKQHSTIPSLLENHQRPISNLPTPHPCSHACAYVKHNAPTSTKHTQNGQSLSPMRYHPSPYPSKQQHKKQDLLDWRHPRLVPICPQHTPYRTQAARAAYAAGWIPHAAAGAAAAVVVAGSRNGGRRLFSQHPATSAGCHERFTDCQSGGQWGVPGALVGLVSKLRDPWHLLWAVWRLALLLAAGTTNIHASEYTNTHGEACLVCRMSFLWLRQAIA